jgi:hypothetical protein
VAALKEVAVPGIGVFADVPVIELLVAVAASSSAGAVHASPARAIPSIAYTDPEVAWAGLSIHPHPTSSETVGMAAKVALGVVTDLPPARSHLRAPALAVAGGPSGAHVRAVTWH